MTPLGAALSLRETRRTAIDRIVREAEKARSAEKAAAALGVGRRTLQKWIAKYPELKKALVAIGMPERGTW